MVVSRSREAQHLTQSLITESATASPSFSGLRGRDAHAAPRPADTYARSAASVCPPQSCRTQRSDRADQFFATRDVVSQSRTRHVQRSLLRQRDRIERRHGPTRSSEQTPSVRADASTFSPFSNVVLPTESYTTSTPLPPVRRFVSTSKSDLRIQNDFVSAGFARQFGFFVCRYRRDAHARRSYAPSAVSSSPTPPAAACTSAVSPLLQRIGVVRQIVRGHALQHGGGGLLIASRPAESVPVGPQQPRRIPRIRSQQARTRRRDRPSSPISRPRPLAVTTPAPSWPGVNGSGALYRPSRK